jgi:thiol:disulfide interchange protein DsbD
MKKLLIYLLLIPFFIAKALPEAQEATTAFHLSGQIVNKQLILNWKIANGFLLYRDKIAVKTQTPSPISLGNFTLPVGIEKHDEVLGNYQVYQHQLQLAIPLQHYQPSESRIIVDFQGCSVSGFCYPPQRRLLTLQLSAFGAQVQSIETIPYVPKTVASKPATHSSFILALLSFFGIGILLAFTPCVLPMLPILSSIIIGKKRSLAQAFYLSLTYVLAMSVSYAASGLAAGLLGTRIQAALQSPWVISLFTLLFVVLALSLFGAYDLQLPARWQTTLMTFSQRQRSGSYLGVAIMGALSILIVSPCISAALVAALAYISQAGHTSGGALLLFVMGLGMGLPLLIVGTFGEKLIPKTGLWMNKIKKILGILLLVTAIWLLYRLIPGNYCLILWGVLAIVSSIFLGIFKFSKFTQKTILWFLLGWLCFFAGILYLTGGLLGNHDPLHPLSSTQQQRLHFITIKTPEQLQQALEKSRGKMVMIDFYASWCVSCKIIEQNVFNQADVQELLKSMVLLKIDVSANSENDKALQDQFKVFAPPTIVFIDENGKPAPAMRLVGEFSKQEFVIQLKQTENRNVLR